MLPVVAKVAVPVAKFAVKHRKAIMTGAKVAQTAHKIHKKSQEQPGRQTAALPEASTETYDRESNASVELKSMLHQAIDDFRQQDLPALEEQYGDNLRLLLSASRSQIDAKLEPIAGKNFTQRQVKLFGALATFASNNKENIRRFGDVVTGQRASVVLDARAAKAAVAVQDALFSMGHRDIPTAQERVAFRDRNPAAAQAMNQALAENPITHGMAATESRPTRVTGKQSDFMLGA